MELSSLRLRRTLTGLLTLHRSLSATSSTIPFPHSASSPLPHCPTSAQSPALPQHSWTLRQSRTFRLSSLSSARSAPYGNNEEIGPDTILFEGCDYNHWLIVMDFPKDEAKPSSEEMVRTYEETCARGLNISVEEAKQKMYACSTTTYTGFQVVMSEEESNKFEGLPGVIFVLPDSYIDPKNKEYGGDKYMNGTIIPRPPPVQYGRQGGRYNDRNRNPNQGRYDRQGPMSNQQGPISNQHGNPPYGQQWLPMQGRGNNEASQNYSPPIQGENKGPIVNTPRGRDAYQPGRDPSYQGNYNQGEQRGYYPREQRNIPQGDQRNYAPQGGTRGDDRNYGPPHTETHGQGYGQGQSSGAYGQGSSPGAYGQVPSPGAYEQGPSPGAYGQRPSSGGYGPGTASGNGQSYAGNGGDERFSQGEQRNVHGEQSNYAPMVNNNLT